jgi:hypothetical protein
MKGRQRRRTPFRTQAIGWRTGEEENTIPEAGHRMKHVEEENNAKEAGRRMEDKQRRRIHILQEAGHRMEGRQRKRISYKKHVTGWRTE